MLALFTQLIAMTSPTYEGYETLVEISMGDVKRQTDASLPLFIPWHPNTTIPLGTLYHSNRLNSPWAKNTPFDERSLATTPMVISRDYGSQSSFKSLSTSKSMETNDHLDLGFAVGAGPPFVASITVKGTYCRDVQDNKDVSLGSSILGSN